MKKRFAEAGITIEQIIDGTTGCQIWFFINMMERECITSVEEQIDGSAAVTLSSVDDLLTIPEDFYLLTGHQKTGANSCVFGSFVAKDKSVEILGGITLEEVAAKGLFEPMIRETVADAEAIPDIASPDRSLLENPKDLLAAFDPWGLKPAWFNDLSKHPWLNEAKKIPGKPGRGGFAALFCPYEVMQGMANESRKSRLTEQRGWDILEKNFPRVFANFEIGKPDFNQSD